MNRLLAVGMLIFMCGVCIASTPQFVPSIVFVRNVVLRSQPYAKRCDALNWPVDDDECRNLETAIGQTVMRRAKKESK